MMCGLTSAIGVMELPLQRHKKVQKSLQRQNCTAKKFTLVCFYLVRSKKELRCKTKNFMECLWKHLKEVLFLNNQLELVVMMCLDKLGTFNCFLAKINVYQPKVGQKRKDSSKNTALRNRCHQRYEEHQKNRIR